MGSKLPAENPLGLKPPALWTDPADWVLDGMKLWPALGLKLPAVCGLAGLKLPAGFWLAGKVLGLKLPAMLPPEDEEEAPSADAATPVCMTEPDADPGTNIRLPALKPRPTLTGLGLEISSLFVTSGLNRFPCATLDEKTLVRERTEGEVKVVATLLPVCD